jgi:hypothetical protein
LTNDVIDSLTYDSPDDEEFEVPILKSEKALMSTFLVFIIHRTNIINPVGNNWSFITKAEFDDFRIDPTHMGCRRNVQNVTGASNTSTVTTPRYAIKQAPPAAEIFKKRIRRDQSLFPTLKDDKFHDSWHRAFENQAHAQDIADVLDPNYSPTSPPEQELFTMKQVFVYAALESKVLTSKGKEIERKFEGTIISRAAMDAAVDER